MTTPTVAPPHRDSRLAGPLQPSAVTIAEARELLAPFIGQIVSRQTMLNWVRKGAFPNVRQKTLIPNSQWIIPWADLVAYVRRAYPAGPIDGSTVAPAHQARFDALVAEACFQEA